MSEATTVLARISELPGYHYLPINADWQTLSAPFSSRLYGTKQVTDAYLLGLAVRSGSVPATMDGAILHLAGNEHRKAVFLCNEKSMTHG